MKKFNCPDLLYVAQKLSTYEDFFDTTTENLASLIDWFENQQDEENKVSVPVKIVISMIFDRMLDIKNEINDLRNEFPSMSMDEWNKFRERWIKFIEGMDDLKLNN